MEVKLTERELDFLILLVEQNIPFQENINLLHKIYTKLLIKNDNIKN